ncbi:TetR/AcrR family transcriptional regulator [Periweissella beninensis]|uniref:TetR/AcrR family transcriptional regulator n=1 Tax=Periweissella beninensis TaxID=504936 RepID=A0ABT0VIM6_9LACO|nr:TetR/AcrR family transcriptional regulator [Periweissella beninensis]MBM7543962.1 AcrR family transcriptional regulator [Periweissella beninensis]MCM2437688.1 TetR/AcrR family transcriptional regulator [Periweissella beninensis]MCT4395704.1 TetR/AcrR family transcriptional regulator [Periweissella beninensis]
MKQSERVLETKQKLKNSFITLIEENGLKNVSISQLVKHANLSRGTFYINYKDLNALLVEIETELYTNILNDFQSKISDTSIYNEIFFKSDSLDNVYLSFSNVLNYIYQNIRTIRVLILSSENPELLAKIKKLVENVFITTITANHGQFNNALPTDYTIQLLVDCLFSIVIHWVKKENPESPEEVAIIIAKSRLLAPKDLIVNHNF